MLDDLSLFLQAHRADNCDCVDVRAGVPTLNTCCHVLCRHVPHGAAELLLTFRGPYTGLTSTPLDLMAHSAACKHATMHPASNNAPLLFTTHMSACHRTAKTSRMSPPPSGGVHCYTKQRPTSTSLDVLLTCFAFGCWPSFAAPQPRAA